MPAHFPLTYTTPVSPPFPHTQGDSSFCSQQSLHMGCLNATIWAAVSELSAGPEASDASLAFSAWHSSSQRQSVVTRCVFPPCCALHEPMFAHCSWSFPQTWQYSPFYLSFSLQMYCLVQLATTNPTTHLPLWHLNISTRFTYVGSIRNYFQDCCSYNS